MKKRDWLEGTTLKEYTFSFKRRSNTCPQCRCPCTATQLIKVYFNVKENLDTTQVNALLLKKLDNLENKLKTFETNATVHKNAMEKMQETIEHLVVELRIKDNNMLTLREDMRQSRYAIAEVQEKLENVHLFCKSTTSGKQNSVRFRIAS
uniref:Uncharacterized protein n=1 Tax=Anopheles culicifacies TaxID=139723 RepID=A0A182MCE2_9DIPT